MAMDLRDPNVWISHLLENLPEEKLASALKDDNPNWEYIDGEIVKLGSLAHSQLDIPELQRRGLVILASESKDFRLLAHLLRTLQHAGDPHLALRLLALYVEHYWAVAAPQNMAHKKRFASQVIKRFETGIEGFSQNAATEQRDALSGELAKLAQCWQSHNAPELAQATDDLFALYQRAFNRAAPAPVPTPAASGSSPQTTATSESGVTQPSAPAPQIVIDSHDDKAWRDTLLKVAAILCERQPDSPQGYRLRRHALWQNITSTPQAESDGRTPLAAVSADMVADYHAQLGSADMALWQQVEKSVLLAPYWLDGHCLSAQTALRLGYKQVADAIRDEVIRFLERLPQLTGLLFNDHTPFISEQTKQWLAASPDAKVAPVAQIGEESKAARACFAEQGLEAALRYLDMLPEGDPRDQFHRQYAPETQASSTPEAVVPPLPGLPEMKVEVRSLTENPPQASVIKQGSTVRGFIAGIACSVAVASALWWWQVYPVQQQLLQVNDTAQGAATVWMASPELENYERRLQQLLDTSPVQPLETGMQMMRVADSRWPESLQQQQASTQWNEALKTRAQSSPLLRGWLQTRQDLHAFADLVMQREKEGLTLSYIKNVIWQAERGLGQETPVESLLTQYHDARAQKQNTDALEKQINERLEGVLSRWLLLKNNVMPEAATGTTAEK